MDFVFWLDILFSCCFFFATNLHAHLTPSLVSFFCFCCCRGCLPLAIEVGEPCVLNVDASEAGKADLQARVRAPSGKELPVEVTKVGEDQYRVSFVPEEEGPHTIDVDYDNDSIFDSVLVTNAVKKPDAGKVVASGPGLESGIVDKPAQFLLDIRNAGNGGLGINVSGPSEADVDCQDNGDGTCSVFYTPKSAGPYTINVLFADEPIPGSPFTANVIDPSKVSCNGPGLENGCFKDFPCTFELDCSEAGEPPISCAEEPIECTVLSPTNTPCPALVEADPEREGVYKVTYQPEEVGRHTIDPTYAGFSIPNFPKQVEVHEPIDLDKILVEGNGLGDGMLLYFSNILKAVHLRLWCLSLSLYLSISIFFVHLFSHM